MRTAPALAPRSRALRRLFLGLVVAVVAVAGFAFGVLARDGSDGATTSISLRGSGTADTQTRAVASFTAVDLAGSNDVRVTVGGGQAVVVHADDNLIDLVTTRVESGTLVVGTKGSFTTRVPMSVKVTVPAIDAVVLSGSGVVSVDGVEADRLAVRVPGSGVLSVRGTAGKLAVDLSGSGDVWLQELHARDVVATLSGSGQVHVHATGSLAASVAGSGVIVYGGNPRTLDTDVSGSGLIVAGP